jgi:hypothetical protein
MSAWRRALALVVTQAAFLALPGVACVALAAEPAPTKCSVRRCVSRSAAIRCATTLCCEARPAEPPTAARRADDLVLPPSAVRTPPADVAFHARPRAQPASDLSSFRAPPVLRL